MAPKRFSRIHFASLPECVFLSQDRIHTLKNSINNTILFYLYEFKSCIMHFILSYNYNVYGYFVCFLKYSQILLQYHTFAGYTAYFDHR